MKVYCDKSTVDNLIETTEKKLKERMPRLDELSVGLQSDCEQSLPQKDRKS